MSRKPTFYTNIYKEVYRCTMSLDTQNLDRILSLTDAAFAIRSYCDYCETAANRTADMIGYTNEFINAIDVESDGDTPTSLLSILESHDIKPDAILSCNEGWISVADYAAELQSALPGCIHDDTDLNVASFDDIPLLVERTDGSIASVSLSEFLEDSKSNLAALYAKIATLKAGLQQSIADRVSAFNTYLTSKIDISAPQFAGVITYCTQMLNSELDAFEILRMFTRDEGAEEISNEVALNFNTTKLGQFTGANPLGAFSTSVLRDGVVSVGRTVGAAAVLIGATVLKIGKAALSKATSALKEALVNPYDVFVDSQASKDALPCFKDFQWQYDSRLYADGSSNPHATGVLFQLIRNANYTSADVRTELSPRLGHWFTYKSMGGQSAVRLTSSSSELSIVDEGVITVDDTSHRLFSVRSHVQFAFKPLPLKYEGFDRMLWTVDSAHPEGFWDQTQLGKLPIISYNSESTMDEVDEHNLPSTNAGSQCLYASEEDEEWYLYNCFLAGAAAHMTSLQLVSAEAGLYWKQHYNEILAGSRYDIPINFSIQQQNYGQINPYGVKTDTDTITNADWLFLAAAVRASAGSYIINGSNCPARFLVMGRYHDNPTDQLIEVTTVEEFAKLALCMAIWDINNSVNDSGEFLPYRMGTEGFGAGKFLVKTDLENQNVATKTATAILAILITVVLVATGVAVAKRISRAMYFKRKTFVSQCDAKLWASPPIALTASEQRRYLRYSKKLNMMSAFSEGLTPKSVFDSIRDAVTPVMYSMNDTFQWSKYNLDTGVNSLVGVDPVSLTSLSRLIRGS